MARFASMLIPASSSSDLKVTALAAVTSSAELSIGKRRIFSINATQDVTIAFGLTGMTAATAANYRIPSNQQTTFDMGDNFTHIRVFNLAAAATADVYIKLLSTL